MTQFLRVRRSPSFLTALAVALYFSSTSPAHEFLTSEVLEALRNPEVDLQTQSVCNPQDRPQKISLDECLLTQMLLLNQKNPPSSEDKTFSLKVARAILENTHPPFPFSPFAIASIILRESKGKADAANYFPVLINGEKIIKDWGIAQINLTTLRETFQNSEKYEALLQAVQSLRNPELKDEVTKIKAAFTANPRSEDGKDIISLGEFFKASAGTTPKITQNVANLLTTYNKIMIDFVSKPDFQVFFMSYLLNQKRLELSGRGPKLNDPVNRIDKYKTHFKSSGATENELNIHDAMSITEDTSVLSYMTYNSNGQTYQSKNPELYPDGTYSVMKSYGIDIHTSVLLMRGLKKDPPFFPSDCSELVTDSDFPRLKGKPDFENPTNRDKMFNTCESLRHFFKTKKDVCGLTMSENSDCRRFHVVKAHEGLYGIAREEKLSLDRLLILNKGFTKDTELSVNQKICVE